MNGGKLKNLKMENDEGKMNIPHLVIERDAMTQEMLIDRSGYESEDKNLLFTGRQYLKECNALNAIKEIIPIVSWLPKYSVKNYLIGDIIAGMTVAVMHIPQGMAYGILAGVQPSNGLYMAFFPVLIYMIFGTSRHISIGTFAVISLMTLKVVETYSTPEMNVTNSTLSSPELPSPVYTPLEVATATALMVGITQLLMAVCFLGFIANLLNEPLVNGFTTGAALHVVCAQLKDIFGISIARRNGAFKIIYTLTDIFGIIDKANIAAIIFSLGVIVFMILMNELVKPFLQKKIRFPLPAELIAVISGTLISKYGEMGSKYSIILVGNIPTGLPAPAVPPMSLLQLVWFDSFVIAIISYSVVISMGFMFAKKYFYQISPNQELIALGIANLVGGTFSCIPVTCSLSRSLIQAQTGGMTQIASAVSAFLILMVLLWIGPFFETLPRCVLAGIIIVALKPMFVQIKNVKRFSKEGKLELLLWTFTFLCVVIIDIDYGLLIGFCISLLILYIKGWKSESSLVGNIPNTEIYVDLKYHRNAVDLPNIKIFRYYGYINFATQLSYKRRLYELLELSADKLLKATAKKESISYKEDDQLLLLPFKVIILDLHTVSHIDVSGCKTISEIMSEMKKIDVKVFLAGPSEKVYNALIHSTTLGVGPFDIFTTVHDAVLYSRTTHLV